MRILIQECLKAFVTINGVVHSSIGKGEVIFVGFTQGDDESVIDKMLDKLFKLRIFNDENGKTNYNLAQHGGEILAVSQFTLYADIKEGNRPSFTKALGAALSKPLYNAFRSKLLQRMPDAKFGVFGAKMEIGLINNGPFTIWMDSEELFSK